MRKVLQTIAQYGQREMHCGDFSSGSSAWVSTLLAEATMHAMRPIATKAASRCETMGREANICAAPHSISASVGR
jgi:hypothetical protein